MGGQEYYQAHTAVVVIVTRTICVCIEYVRVESRMPVCIFWDLPANQPYDTGGNGIQKTLGFGALCRDPPAGERGEVSHVQCNVVVCVALLNNSNNKTRATALMNLWWGFPIVSSLKISGPATATAAATLARRRVAHQACCRPTPSAPCAAGAAARQLLSRREFSGDASSRTTGNSQDSSSSAGRQRRWNSSCVGGNAPGNSGSSYGDGRYRWGGQQTLSAIPALRRSASCGGSSAAAFPAAAVAGGGARGRGTAAAGAARGLSSSFLADAVRESATNHCIDRVVNGSLDGTVTAAVSEKLGKERLAG